MDTHIFTEVLKTSLGFGSGALIGYAFGLIQNIALRKNMLREQKGEFKNAWSSMPGSGQRIAVLLLALVGVQIICPLLFVDGTQWLVSGGLVVGYGIMLYRNLRQRTATLM